MAVPSPKRTRRQEILAAAADLFYERSYAAVGMDAVGERAGVSGSGIYRHFSGKDEILATLFDEAIDGLLLATGGHYEDPWQQLSALARGHATFVLEQRRLAGVKIREERSLAVESSRRLRERERRYVDRWTASVAECRPDLDSGEHIARAQAVLGMLNSIATWPPAALRVANLVDVAVTAVVGAIRAGA